METGENGTQNGIGDANDIWKIMIVGGRDNDTILTVTSKLLIVHYLQNCALTTSGKQLPKWGFEQQEVSCNPNVRDPTAYWNVEDNAFEKCKYIWILIWKSTFVSDFHLILSFYNYIFHLLLLLFHFPFFIYLCESVERN